MSISRQRSITQKEVRERYLYFPFDGVLTNRKTNGSKGYVGFVVGRINKKNGYRDVRIGKYTFLAHRLAWLYTYGYTPEHDLDHLDGVKDYNNVSNLREATKVCNMQNTKMRKDNTSGFTGVSMDARNGFWLLRIHVKGKTNRLGLYENKLEAALARLTAEIWCQKWHCNHQNNIVKQIQEVWPDFDKRSIL